MYNSLYWSRINRNLDIARDVFGTSPEWSALLADVLDKGYPNYLSRMSQTENENAYVMTFELPGFKMGDLDISAEKNELTIVAKKGEKSYKQLVTIPSGVANEVIEARLEDGILSITLPKSALAKSRKIQIVNGNFKA